MDSLRHARAHPALLLYAIRAATPKRPFQVWLPTGQVTCSLLLPPRIPHAVRTWSFKVPQNTIQGWSEIPTIPTTRLTVTILSFRHVHAARFAQLAETLVENPMINGEIIRLDGAKRLPFEKPGNLSVATATS
jgi:hypothetical protein